MNRAAAISIACLVPVFAVAFYVLTRTMTPIWGYFAALGVYWVALIVLLVRYWPDYRPNLSWRLPALWIWVAQAVMLAGVAVAAALALSAQPAALAYLPLIAVIALTNGTLEELFWRGVLLPAPQARDAALALALFVGWHLALLAATGVHVTGGALGLLGGAFFGGLLWTMARLQTGTVGFGIVAHVLLNLFAFSELTVHNL